MPSVANPGITEFDLTRNGFLIAPAAVATLTFISAPISLAITASLPFSILILKSFESPIAIPMSANSAKLVKFASPT